MSYLLQFYYLQYDIFLPLLCKYRGPKGIRSHLISIQPCKKTSNIMVYKNYIHITNIQRNNKSVKVENYELTFKIYTNNLPTANLNELCVKDEDTFTNMYTFIRMSLLNKLVESITTCSTIYSVSCVYNRYDIIEQKYSTEFCKIIIDIQSGILILF